MNLEMSLVMYENERLYVIHNEPREVLTTFCLGGVCAQGLRFFLPRYEGSLPLKEVRKTEISRDSFYPEPISLGTFEKFIDSVEKHIDFLVRAGRIIRGTSMYWYSDSENHKEVLLFN